MKMHYLLVLPLLGLNFYTMGQELQKAEDCPTGNEQVEPVNNDYEHRVVELVNEERATQNLPPLKKSQELFYSARFHAKDMCETGYMQHPSLNSQDQVVCKTGNRIQKFYNVNPWRENIAGGQSTPSSVNNTWIQSDGHYANMMAQDVREIGVGYYNNCANLGPRWVENFGSNAGTFPIVINREEFSTNSRSVDLYIYGKENYDEMRLKNEGDEWTDWMSFQTKMDWNLIGDKGFKTVKVEMKAGPSTTISSDQIYYGSNPPSSNGPNKEENAEFSIYPNPVSNQAKVKVTAPKPGNYEMVVLNSLGQQVKNIYSGTIPSGNKQTFQVTTDNMPSGIYFLKLQSGKERSNQVKKFIVR